MGQDGHIVVVVDDEADLRELICQILEDEGYSVRAAGDSTQTLDAIEDRIAAERAEEKICEKPGIAAFERAVRRVEVVMHRRDVAHPRGEAVIPFQRLGEHECDRAVHGPRRGVGTG